jgi:hypothetical protein
LSYNIISVYGTILILHLITVAYIFSRLSEEVEPKVNMPVDVLDDEFIWNLARIVCVSSEGSKCNVTVQYEGWGPEWDIVLPYPNERLARVFTYTRQVRCFAVLLGSNKIEIDDKVNIPEHKFLKKADNLTDVWPCKVSFRMPHNNRQSACNALRKEHKVYVQPYMTYALPKSVQNNMTYGGQWVETSRLLPWKDFDASNPINIFKRVHIIQEVKSTGGLPAGGEPSLSSSQSIKSYKFAKDFCVAYQTALSDWIQGYLPPQALSEGVLLNDEYRIFPNDVEAYPIDVCRYSGSLAPRKMELRDPIQNGVTNHGANPPLCPDATEIAFASIPSLPSPIPIIHKASSNPCIRYLEASNRWAGVLHVAGNDLFLGSYASQCEAERAVRLALAQLRKETCQGGVAGVEINRIDAGGIEFENTMRHLTPFPDCDSLFVPNAAHTADLFNTTAESVVSAFEKTQQPMNSERKPSSEPTFHLQDWIRQHYRHVWPVKQLTFPSGGRKCDMNIRSMRRKQTNPMRSMVK